MCPEAECDRLRHRQQFFLLCTCTYAVLQGLHKFLKFHIEDSHGCDCILMVRIGGVTRECSWHRWNSKCSAFTPRLTRAANHRLELGTQRSICIHALFLFLASFLVREKFRLFLWNMLSVSCSTYGVGSLVFERCFLQVGSWKTNFYLTRGRRVQDKCVRGVVLHRSDWQGFSRCVGICSGGLSHTSRVLIPD
jgi:hypothetical protein